MAHPRCGPGLHLRPVPLVPAFDRSRSRSHLEPCLAGAGNASRHLAPDPVDCFRCHNDLSLSEDVTPDALLNPFKANLVPGSAPSGLLHQFLDGRLVVGGEHLPGFPVGLVDAVAEDFDLANGHFPSHRASAKVVWMAASRRASSIRRRSFCIWANRSA